MNSEDIVSSNDIQLALDHSNLIITQNEGRLMLSELLLKAGAGYHNSHTEELFMQSFGLLTKNRIPNKKGRLFLCSMLYTHSNKRPLYFELMQAHRAPSQSDTQVRG